MGAIQRKNPTLKGVLPRDYSRPSLDTATRASANRICESHRQDFCEAKDRVRLGGLVDIISNFGFNESAAKSKDVLGRVYEYFLGKFASAEGKGGGEFYTPQCVVPVLAAMLEPYKVRELAAMCPPADLLEEFDKKVSPLIRRIFANCNESRTRDALLSGELRVKEAYA